MNRMKGFTLIELLIVIAVLGVLAVAVLSALNPIEQINRSRDTGSRSDSEQLLGAVERFYATKGYYPWQVDADDTANELIDWVDVPAAADTDLPPVTVLEKLATGTTAEVKDAFRDRIENAATRDYLYLYRSDSSVGNSAYVCFLPRSEAQRSAAFDRCTDVIANGSPADYPVAAAEACGGDIDSSYSCLP